MPIEYDFPVKVLSQDEFHAIDRKVMRHAFDVQNDLGRFFDENIYHNELAFRLGTDGLSVVSEGAIRVCYKDFVKHYYLDVLVASGALYELKAVDVLIGAHEKQLLHYLFLLGLKHGKLINFSPASVEHRFVSTRLTAEVRSVFTLNDSLFDSCAYEGRLMREILGDLLAEWGAFLEVSLYEEALIHFLGGSDKLVRPLDICIGGRVVGVQKNCLLQETEALHVSAIVKNMGSYRRFLERMFGYTDLTQIQWINFNRSTIDLVTLKK